MNWITNMPNEFKIKDFPMDQSIVSRFQMLDARERPLNINFLWKLSPRLVLDQNNVKYLSASWI